jgi:2-hydroxycyclohexanecarboxyl-CoA dehydrogenase
MTDLSGKTAIVLGAAGPDNMGQHIARSLAGAGAQIVVAGRHLEPLKALVAEIGGTAALCDITRKAEVDALFDAHPAQIAVNATGWGLLKPIDAITEEELDAIVALQFKAVHHMLAACVRTMREGGAIVQISSATTVTPIDDHAAYIGTKAGSEGLIRAIASQYGARGIRANVVSPGLTASPMTAGALATPGLEAAFAARYPLGRIGTSDDVAAAVLWLCDPRCFVTGQNLQVNGGLTLCGNPRGAEVAASVQQALARG